MSKYSPLWDYIKKSETSPLTMTFEEIREIAGVPLDHAFLQYKKELPGYGWQVKKISMKSQVVIFERTGEEPS